MKVDDLIVFLGHPDQPARCSPVFKPGEMCSVRSLERDGGVRCCSFSPRGVLEHWRKDTLYAGEFILVAGCRTPGASLGPGEPDWESVSAEIDRILDAPDSKKYCDLRDRAAYVFVTGTLPSHLRTFFTRALVLIIRMHRSGSFKVDEFIVEHMALENHPMVIKVREYLACGWRIQVSKGPNSRKPFSKILVHRGGKQKTIQIDGSVKDGWA